MQRATVALLVVTLVLTASIQILSKRSVLAITTVATGSAGQATAPFVLPIREGSGSILPSSPFFFLDNLWDNIRLLFIIDPIARAKLRLSIAAERIAEVKVELEAQDQHSIDVGLANLRSQTEGVKKALELARRQHVPLSGPARELLDKIDQEQEALTMLSTVADQETKLALESQIQSFENVAADVLTELQVDEQSMELRKRLIRQIEASTMGEMQSASDAARLSRQWVEEASRSMQRLVVKRNLVKEQLAGKGDDVIRKAQEDISQAQQTLEWQLKAEKADIKGKFDEKSLR